MFLFNKTKRAEHIRKQKAIKAHRKALGEFLPSSGLNPLLVYQGNTASSIVFTIVPVTIITSLMTAFAMVILSDPYETIARILYAAWKVTGGEFQSLLAGFGAALIMLTSMTLYAFTYAMQFYGPRPDVQTVLDTLVEMDERTQDQIAEIRLLLQDKEDGA